MQIHTYYHVLGVSRDATPAEITNAKNALAKIYHPDANMNHEIDTTAYMQEILEAYQVLSDPVQRKKYDQKLSGGANRVFRTYKVGEPDGQTQESDTFVTFWNAALKLQETVANSSRLLQQDAKQKTLAMKLLEKIGKVDKTEKEQYDQLCALSVQALQYIAVLNKAEIPVEYWNPEAMNWVLIRWGQNQTADYQTLFAKYDAYLNQKRSGTERLRLKSQNRQFKNNLKKLLAYAL